MLLSCQNNETSAIVALLFNVGDHCSCVCRLRSVEAFGALIDGMVVRQKYIANVIIRKHRFIFTGVAVSISCGSPVWHIGAEDNMSLVPFLPTIVERSSRPSTGITGLLVLLVEACLQELPQVRLGWCEAKFGIQHEVITSIMLDQPLLQQLCE